MWSVVCECNAIIWGRKKCASIRCTWKVGSCDYSLSQVNFIQFINLSIALWLPRPACWRNCIAVIAIVRMRKKIAAAKCWNKLELKVKKNRALVLSCNLLLCVVCYVQLFSANKTLQIINQMPSDSRHFSSDMLNCCCRFYVFFCTISSIGWRWRLEWKALFFCCAVFTFSPLLFTATLFLRHNIQPQTHNILCKNPASNQSRCRAHHDLLHLQTGFRSLSRAEASAVARQD